MVTEASPQYSWVRADAVPVEEVVGDRSRPVPGSAPPKLGAVVAGKDGESVAGDADDRPGACCTNVRPPRRKEALVSVVAQMLDTYPKDLGKVDRGKLTACIEACVECAQACTACADACLSEDMVADLATCIRTCADCADVCGTTGRVLSRHTGYDANVTRAVLEACATACRSCGDECTRHAEMHEHCRVCAESCRRCEQACRTLLDALG
jgi:hypothetical protein